MSLILVHQLIKHRLCFSIGQSASGVFLYELLDLLIRIPPYLRRSFNPEQAVLVRGTPTLVFIPVKEVNYFPYGIFGAKDEGDHLLDAMFEVADEEGRILCNESGHVARIDVHSVDATIKVKQFRPSPLGGIEGYKPSGRPEVSVRVTLSISSRK